MKTLAIDTSHAAGSVAALAAGTVAEAVIAAGDTARLLVPALADVAHRLGWRPRDAALVVVVRGPGSFTGLRVGVATAKAVAWAGNATLVGVSAFDVVARIAARHLAGHAGPLEIAFDAGRGEAFVATATPAAAEPTGWQVPAGRLVPLAAWLAALPPGTCVSGPALAAVRDPLPADLVIAPRAAWFPSAAEAAAAGLLLAAAGRTSDPAGLVPDYLRPSYVEDKRPD